MSIKKFDPISWASYLPELLPFGAADYGDIIHYQKRDVLLDQAKYAMIKVGDVDGLQRYPAVQKVIMRHVFHKVKDAMPQKAVCVLASIEAFTRPSEDADYIKCLFVYGGEEAVQA